MPKMVKRPDRTGPLNTTSQWVTEHIISKKHHHLNNFEGNKATFYTKASKGKGKLTQGKGDNTKCAHCKKKGHKKAEKKAAKNATTDSGNANSTLLTSSSSATVKITVASKPDPPAYSNSTII